MSTSTLLKPEYEYKYEYIFMNRSTITLFKILNSFFTLFINLMYYSPTIEYTMVVTYHLLKKVLKTNTFPVELGGTTKWLLQLQR